MEMDELEAQFEVRGSFRVRDGAGKSQPHSKRKLCLVATDKRYLVGLLYAYSQRGDCYWVKYRPAPLDGMYLGRVFFADDATVGAEWAALKRDAKVLCSVQDDDFISRFRRER
jgi:hypothetical protein